jgi:farnesol dehydrogenase
MAQMKIFISGATGFIGSSLALNLAQKGHTIHALYRSNAKSEILKHPNIKLFKGDILDMDSLNTAIKDCSYVFHAAAYTSIWTKDPSEIYHLNIDGAVNVIKASVNAGVKRIIVTSTAGIFGYSKDGTAVNETSKAEKFFIDYEHSKAILENYISLLSLTGIDIITLNPTRVFGPGLMCESNSVSKMIASWLKGRWRLIPGDGNQKGNYIFIEDVIEGHILAMEKGKAGEKYILGGENISYNEFFKQLSILTGENHTMLHIPLPVMLFAARVSTALAWIGTDKTFITPSLVRKFNHNFIVSSEKAMKDLGFKPAKLKEGFEKTIEWIKNSKL